MIKYQAVRFISNYLSEVRTELAKVIWPKKSEAIRLTTTVVLISLIVAAYLGTLDFAFTKLLEYIISR